MEEQKHQNSNDELNCKVVVSDPAPIVILFGVRGSGKTMMLVRLVRWLITNGYYVEPVRDFVATSDIYLNICDSFDKAIHSEYAAPRTLGLVRIMDRYGKTLCQILDVAGDCLHNACHPQAPLPLFMNYILHTMNHKIWLFLAEANWGDTIDRRYYAEKIGHLQVLMTPSDKLIFACTKADEFRYLLDKTGEPYIAEFFKTIANQYYGIFSPFENINPITKLWHKYNFDFVVFSAGKFYQTENGSLYQESCDKYPASLWKSIKKAL